MHRLKSYLIAAGIAGAVAVPVLSLGSSSAATGAGHRHFTVVSHDALGSITPADFGMSPVQNQSAAADAPVTRGSKTIGRTETLITITRVSDKDLEFIIECGTKLPGGQVLFNGAGNFNDLGKGVTIPVVGGTGRYRGARGIVVMKQTDPSATTLAFDFTTA